MTLPAIPDGLNHSMSKSRAIREFKRLNPDAKPKEIAAALNPHWPMKPQFVSTVLCNAKSNRNGSGEITAKELKEFAGLVRKFGSIKRVSELIEAMEEIGNVV